jgi:hypothetical protein
VLEELADPLVRHALHEPGLALEPARLLAVGELDRDRAQPRVRALVDEPAAAATSAEGARVTYTRGAPDVGAPPRARARTRFHRGRPHGAAPSAAGARPPPAPAALPAARARPPAA